MIAEVKARRNFNKMFAPGLLEALCKHINDFHYRSMATENGGLATNLTEKAVDKLAERVYLATIEEGLSKDEARLLGQTLTAIDYGINEDITLGDPELQREIEAEVRQLVGMRTVQEFFTVMKTKAQYVEKGGDPQTLRTSLNMVLTGNPGRRTMQSLFVRSQIEVFAHHIANPCFLYTQAPARPRSHARLPGRHHAVAVRSIVN
jgi:hypothetical protein